MKFLFSIGVVVILGLYLIESKFIVCEHVLDKKKKEIWLSHNSLNHPKIKKSRDNTKMSSKTSIAQRVRTDLGRSVCEITAIKLVMLNFACTFA